MVVLSVLPKEHKSTAIPWNASSAESCGQRDYSASLSCTEDPRQHVLVGRREAIIVSVIISVYPSLRCFEYGSRRQPLFVCRVWR